SHQGKPKIPALPNGSQVFAHLRSSPQFGGLRELPGGSLSCPSLQPTSVLQPVLNVAGDEFLNIPPAKMQRRQAKRNQQAPWLAQPISFMRCFQPDGCCCKQVATVSRTNSKRHIPSLRSEFGKRRSGCFESREKRKPMIQDRVAPTRTPPLWPFLIICAI